MKKVTYLMTILFAVALMSTSCCKDDPVPEPTGAITLSELEDVWNSTQYDYDVSYITCSDFTSTTNPDVEDGDLMLITLDMTTSDWTLDSKCTSLETYGDGYDYDRDNGKLVLKASGLYSYKFDVVSYDRVTETLVLKLTDENIGGVYPPDNGIYTLQK